MSMLARAALLIVLSLGFVRLAAADADDFASLRAKAERGNALAQYNLGLIYVQGRQVPADPAEAFAWLTLASENGATGKALDSLLGDISDAQLAEGRRRLGTYRTALSAKSSAAPAHGSPKLAPRGFVIEAPPPTPPPAVEPPATLPANPPAATTAGTTASVPATTATPEAITSPIATSPAEGAGVTDLAQARKDLEKTQADLLAANTELATLRATVAQLEAAAAEARATETRLAAELKAAQLELNTLKPVVATAPNPEKTKAEDSTPHQP